MLAHHYGAALELARAAGRETATLENRARVALRNAGERALALSALPAALQFFEHALALWPEEDRDWPSLALRYGQTDFSIRQQGEEPLVARARPSAGGGRWRARRGRRGPARRM